MDGPEVGRAGQGRVENMDRFTGIEEAENKRGQDKRIRLWIDKLGSGYRK